ncbi:MAG TPA: phosphoenolpyruvate--protein phosphotransferase [Thermodesulfobacteriota bacterium]|nr:phosphoenolpyruvate--protein phosphotransferase [Thermodesulfobacteriota bacterium]
MDDRALVERADFHLKIVQEISELVNQSRGLDNILKDIANKIGDSLHFDVVSIYLWDKQGGKLVLRSTRGLKVNPDYPIRLKPDEGLTGLVYETRRSLVVMPASQHPRYKYFSDIGEEEYESYIGVPILLQNRCLGVLVGQTKERRLINPAEETLFQIIASRLAGLLEVADRLERLQSPSIIKPETRTYQGKGVSGGFAVGTVYISRGLSQEISLDELKSYSVEGEISRLTDAFTRVDKDLYSLIQALEEEGVLSKSEISIFETHLLILNGSTFRNAIVGKIKEKGIAAEPAVIEGIESIAGQFENLNDPYLRERAQDFHDLGEKILYYLLRSRGLEKGFQQPREDSIVVAYDIGPSFLTMLHRSKIAAIVAEKGGETSHTAILAKSLGIPAVVGIKNICNLVKSGEELLVDGKTGFIFSNPDRDLVLEYENTHNKLVRLEEIVEKEEADPGNALLPVTITANIGFPVDVDMAKQHRLNDVGLFRTEFAFAQYSRWPGVEEQIKIYEDIGKHFEGYITIRTLDIGADKLLPYFSFPKEENPLLGLRAIRFSMEYLDLFRDQIRAVLLTVKNGYRFRILLPMVSSVWEVETAREIVEQLGNEIGVPFSDLPPLGIMLEVPAVLHQLDDYKDMIDFVSVGTNDLVQYLLAVDRNSSTVGHLYSGFHPAVLRALSDTYLKANSLGKEITVCGEMAGTPLGALALVSLGYTQLSILPSRAPVIRHLCKQISEDYLHDVKLKILNEKNERRVERYLNEALESLDPILIEID